jgi:polysaccharide deacetylase family sporulation protein PdaB
MKIFVITKRTLIIAIAAVLAAVAVISAAIAVPSCSEKEAVNNTEQTGAVNDSYAAKSTVSAVEEYEATVLAGFKKELPVYSVDRSDKRIALTIDAAWDADKTPFILETLAKYNVKATFFLCGVWVKAYPDQVKAIFDAGHTIGNHSLSHPHMTNISQDAVEKEISSLDDLIEKITGQRTVLFRAPFGEYNDDVIRTVRSTGHEPIQWDIDTIDWKPERSANTILDTVFKKLDDGSIILCHNNGYKIEEYLPTLIETAQANGFTFVTVDELLLDGETIIDANGVQKAK